MCKLFVAKIVYKLLSLDTWKPYNCEQIISIRLEYLKLYNYVQIVYFKNCNMKLQNCLQAILGFVTWNHIATWKKINKPQKQATSHDPILHSNSGYNQTIFLYNVRSLQLMEKHCIKERDYFN